MNLPSRPVWASNIFNVPKSEFGDYALKVFRHQVASNTLYKQYVLQRGIVAAEIEDWTAIPFLPISFFKSHEVKSFQGPAAACFTSSGTTGAQTSRHFVQELAWYEKSFLTAFGQTYGPPESLVFLCLLPSYLDRSGSSLVYMANKLVALSGHPKSGFFLHADEALLRAIAYCKDNNQPAILLGVTFALLDFAKKHNGLSLSHITVMETGGMKGRRQELLRAEVHEQLKTAFGLSAVHSEYGMTEMMSQAYATANGRYYPPDWLRVLVRSEEDPFALSDTGTGILCLADLANIDSCAFIETQDIATVYPDGSFEVLGRIDNSDLRGCSLLVL